MYIICCNSINSFNLQLWPVVLGMYIAIALTELIIVAVATVVTIVTLGTEVNVLT